MALVDNDNSAASEILRKLVKESQPHQEPPRELSKPFVAEVERLKTEAGKQEQPPPGPPEPASPLTKRHAVLTEQHGSVFCIQPKGPVEIGQSIPWHRGRDEVKVEVLESADYANEKGEVVPGRFFVKLLDI